MGCGLLKVISIDLTGGTEENREEPQFGQPRYSGVDVCYVWMIVGFL
jgi:hypothetical protein